MRFKLLAAALFMIGAVAAAPADAANFKLTSVDMAPGKRLADAQVFNGFGCSGGNKSPELTWSGAPAGTKSFVVTAYDPDAPTGSGWWHWVLFNIPASVTHLDGGMTTAALPAGAVEGRSDFGTPGFGGACPPPGDKPHHYIFTVYALKTEKLDLDGSASAALIGFMTHANMIGKAVLVARYGRK